MQWAWAGRRGGAEGEKLLGGVGDRGTAMFDMF